MQYKKVIKGKLEEFILGVGRNKTDQQLEDESETSLKQVTQSTPK